MALRRFLLAVAGVAAFFCSPVAAQVAAPNFKNSAGLPQSSQGVIAIGGGSVAGGQVSVGATATLVAAARPRQRVTVTVTTAVGCSFGPAGVSTSTGFPLQPVAGATITLDTSAAIYAVCASTATIGYVELY